MRRSLILTVTAVVTMVLLAMLVPMAVLVRSYALEDRLAQAALEVQATETVVSREDYGGVSVYLEGVNGRDVGIRTTVYYPGGQVVGPSMPPVDDRIEEARTTGRARVDDTDDGAEILVPVSLGGNSTLPALTPVIRVAVDEPGLGSGVGRAWVILAGLGLVLLAGALLLADRLGRAFVRPISGLATHAERLGTPGAPSQVPVEGPPETRDLAAALNRLVTRIEDLLERERRQVADLSHRLRTPITALRLRGDSLRDPVERAKVADDLDLLEQTVDHIVREARRSEREGLVASTDAVAVLVERARFWSPLAEDQGRVLEVVAEASAAAPVRASEADLTALLDVLLDNVFTHTEEGDRIRLSVTSAPGGGAVLVVEDSGPGFPEETSVSERGTSGAGSTGLGLSIAAATAEHSGGALTLGRSDLGGARVEVRLGAPI